MSSNSTLQSVLVTVKAYPQLSQRYRETVCVAGVLLTESKPAGWCRLYPVPFRDLGDEHRFKKYDLITVNTTVPSDDRRPESLRADTDSIQVVRHLGTHDGWRERRRLIEPLIAESMCQVQRDQAVMGTSLAAVRPAEIYDVLVEPSSSARPQRKQMIASQASLFNQGRPELEVIPWTFRYHYRCADPRCKGHRQTIIDWELGQSYRQLRGMPQADRVRRVREKWLEELCSAARDPVFFVGNMHQAPKGFLVLGVFWPPKGADQLLLF